MISPKPQSAGQKGRSQVQPIGGAFGEAFDEQAMMQAMSAKQSSQQAAAPVQQALQQGQGGTAAANDFGANEAMMQQMQKAGATGGMPGMPGAKAPRAVGSLTDELINRPIQDVKEGLQSIFDLNDLLGVNPTTDTPEEQAKKRIIHQNFQRLTQEQQQVAQQQYQEEMERKQREEQEEEEKRRRKQQEESQTIQAPSGKKQGPDAGGGSRKQKAMTKLQNDRKQLGGPGSSN